MELEVFIKAMVLEESHILKTFAIKVGDKFVRKTLGSFKTLKEAQKC